MPLKPRHLTSQDRERRLALKAALRALHSGAYAIPRKKVIQALGVWDTTYSRWLSDEHPDLPGVTDLMVIVSVTGNPGPLQAIAEYCGEGYKVVEDLAMVDEPGSSLGLRIQNLEADVAVDLELAKDLEDGELSPEDAERLLPILDRRGETNRRTKELCRKVLKTGQPARGLQ